MDYKIEKITHLTDSTFVISLPKPKFEFKSGQCVWIMSDKNEYCIRKYAIYSGENDNNLEFLIREISEGELTPILKELKIGDNIDVDVPDGKFTLDPEIAKNNKIVFIASGTGIAPFRSMIKSNSNLDYHIIHGIRYQEEAYNKEEYGNRYTSCTSKDPDGDYNGRVTSYLKNVDFDKNTHFYICGNSKMITDVYELLKNKDIKYYQLHREVYF